MRPYLFTTRILQAIEDHIWTQLGLGYTFKQIYDKHKAIWWAIINAKEAMTKDEFIKQQNIIYLDHKHKRRNLHLHKNAAISHMGILSSI